MTRWVEVTFDCLPLRTVGRVDIPLDASPKFQALLERVKQSLEKHGSFNTYYLYNARCRYHLVNRDDFGMIEFQFEGTVFTDSRDERTERCDLEVTLTRETCDWLQEPIVDWFRQTVLHTVAVEFDRFIEAGDLDKARQRLERLRAQADQQGGYLGMYL